MQDNNPYAAPNATIADVVAEGPRLADRGMRLAAAIIDGLLMLVIILPLMFASGYFSGILTGHRPGFGMQALWAMAGFAIFALVQGFPLNATGQTWGKKLLKIKIVDLDGRKPDLVRLLVMRYLPNQVIGLVPFLGGLYGLVDALFIFSEDRRCLHDKIAGTRVVMAD